MARRRWMLLPVTVALVVAVGAITAYAQRRWFRSQPIDVPIDPAPHYDGRFTFARLKFTTGPGGYYYGGLPAWAHGYLPIREGSRSETNLTKILNGITNIDPHLDGTKVVDVGSLDLFRYPLVYAAEPGYMVLNDKEALNLRAYLQKGGFIIFDDFRGPYDWENFQATMARVLPGEHLIRLDVKHPIFHAFFDIPTLDFIQAYDRGGPAEFYGMFPNNDQSRPLQFIANFNNDVSQYWEWSDTGFVPIDLSNEAYKLGVNYVVYAMTH
ncbi:MAG TPA: DUF4159 domain-containing protein [Vicinamibacterales bacterium]|nr:DUF4159 domain-containing protein [Vicinamibacterales bacterium]